MLCVTPLNYFKGNNKSESRGKSKEREILLTVETGSCFLILNRAGNKVCIGSGTQL